ncbi:MAG: prepilin-type N-terminal cleavage/methylation domain-containing protein [Candidatus Poribacteria bacterium]|jgi:prepilin-type N-terminal cleavage/methylation domain-containing protein|nr:prepilin-type N-terminal cleavage/methylation domain-containing protein [Candidatus Poribacteria bacterium]MDP6747532.1 prepilin-type N-terminal cleavage/methylation domain-containing protein [Candidatus Poribacteria bacterium]MDP6996670.1 prepilin-type N-terminal cleavage/methylation domain-containing protein [Candidatus Poribacteria bacterium]
MWKKKKKTLKYFQSMPGQKSDLASCPSDVKQDTATGFTLVEIVVTIAIISISLPPLMNAFTAGARGQSTAEDRTTALYLLKYKMAEVELQGFPEVQTEEGEFDDNNRYTWSTEVIEIEPEELPEGLVLEGLRQIVVTVYWQFRNSEKSMSLYTLVSDRQLSSQQGQATQQGAGGGQSGR